MDLRFLKLPSRIPAGQLIYFTRQLAVMLRAGIPLVRALHTLSSQLTNRAFAGIVASLAVQVEQGDKLSDALARYPSLFPVYYVNMVKVAEASGSLDEIFLRLASFLENQHRTKKKIISALAYPVFVLLVALVILLIIMGFVVPSFMKMFREYGEALPLPTRLLLGASQFVRERWWIGGLFVVGLFALISFLRRFPGVRYKMDELILLLPGIGGLFKRFYVGRIAQTLSTLLASGVPIVEAISVTRGTIENEVYRALLQRLIFIVEEGDEISSYLRTQVKFFPPLVVEMISLGEETGKLAPMLSQVAEIFEEEMELMVSSLTSLLEPFLIVFMGAVVGFIVIAMFLPLFSLTQIMSR